MHEARAVCPPRDPPDAPTTAARAGVVLELTRDRDRERGRLNLRANEGRGKGRAIVPIHGTLRAALTAAKDAALSDHVIEWACGP